MHTIQTNKNSLVYTLTYQARAKRSLFCLLFQKRFHDFYNVLLFLFMKYSYMCRYLSHLHPIVPNITQGPLYSAFSLLMECHSDCVEQTAPIPPEKNDTNCTINFAPAAVISLLFFIEIVFVYAYHTPFFVRYFPGWRFTMKG